MRKILLSIAFLFLSLRSSPIYPQDVIQRILPDIKVNERKILGEVSSFAIARNSGDYIVASSRDNQTMLNYFDISGNTLWGKTFPHKSVGVDISDNGKVIIVQTSIGEYRVKNSVFDANGNQLWTEESKRALFLSPDGNYITYQILGDFESGTGFQLFTITGKALWNSLPLELNKGEFFIRFVDNQRIFVLKRTIDIQGNLEEKRQKLMMIRIPELHIQWEYYIDTPIWLMNYNSFNTTHQGNSIVFLGRGNDEKKEPTTIFSFRLDGTLLWKNTSIFYADKVALSNDERYVFVYSSTRGGDFYILDNSTGNIIERVKIQPFFTTLLSADLFDNTLVLSGKTFYDFTTIYFILTEDFKIIKEYRENVLTKFAYLGNDKYLVQVFSKTKPNSIQFAKIERRSK